MINFIKCLIAVPEPDELERFAGLFKLLPGIENDIGFLGTGGGGES